MATAFILPPSLQAQFDTAGNRVFDARMSIYVGGTTTPAPVYADAGLGTRLANPVALRSNGTWPLCYVPAGTYDLRMADPDNAGYDAIAGLVYVEPTGGGGGGGTVDDKRLAQTGDVKDRYGTGTHPGWVRLNGRTIGSAASSASERASDDAHDLFVFLWTQDPNLAVSGGRGGTAESDWSAAKTLALPDARGRFRAALDDMGNSAAGRLTGGLFGFGNATALGSYGGEASHTQSVAEMPAHTHVVTAMMDAQGLHAHNGSTSSDGDHYHQVNYFLQNGYSAPGAANAVTSVGGTSSNTFGYTGNAGVHSHSYTTSSNGLHAHNITTSVSSIGSSTSMSWLPPFLLVTPYIKL